MNATESKDVLLCDRLAGGWIAERGGLNARER